MAMTTLHKFKEYLVELLSNFFESVLSIHPSADLKQI
jgi:hypothetical protein